MKKRKNIALEENGINRKQKILNIAGRLFLTQGYDNTTVRQIAKEAGVSLGLVTHHFSEKREMAIALLSYQFSVFKSYIHKYVSLEEDPILYSAVLVKLNWTVLSSPKFYEFYIDVLKNDIYLDVIIGSGIETYDMINRKYNLGLDYDYMMLYGNYTSVSAERTLTLYAKDYTLKESIPDLVFKTYMFYFLSKMDLLNNYCRKSDDIVKQILKENPQLFDLGYLLLDE